MGTWVGRKIIKRIANIPADLRFMDPSYSENVRKPFPYLGEIHG